jgi:mannonate dehydratase
VAHLVDYFRAAAMWAPTTSPRGRTAAGASPATRSRLWSLDELRALRRNVEAAGLKLEAVENFDPAHWHDVLLDGPQRAQHIENVKTIIRGWARPGFPIMGYNFSIAGVAGRTTGNYARGGAPSVGMEGPYDLPMPNGMAWNMVYDPAAPPGPCPGYRTRSCGAFCAVPQRGAAGRRGGRASSWRPIPTIRRCRSSGASRASSTSRASTSG